MIELVAGIALLAIVLVDLLETTLGGNGAGPITRVISAGTRAVVNRAGGAGGRLVHRYAGPVTLALVAAAWITLHWIAWTLIFLSDAGSVVIYRTGEPAGTLQTAGYVGAMLSTLGASRAESGTALWDAVSALVAVNGMVMLTLSVSFIINITRTVTDGRSFAVLVDALDLDDPAHVAHLRTALAGIPARFAAFPLAHGFSAMQRERRVVPAVAAFVERAANEATLASFRPILGLLPGVDAAGDLAAVKASVHRWARRHAPGDPPRSG